jgi:hypothetical protein
MCLDKQRKRTSVLQQNLSHSNQPAAAAAEAQPSAVHIKAAA